MYIVIYAVKQNLIIDNFLFLAKRKQFGTVVTDLK